MSRLEWDKIDGRSYEYGVDRGVLYVPNSFGNYTRGYPWNGLVSVSESFSAVKTTPYYRDGEKYHEERETGEFAATISAFTYPDEFAKYDGVAEIEPGFYVDSQPVRDVFGLSYRTKAGNGLNAESGYKIHVLYDLLATPSDRSYGTVSDSPSATDFTWKVVGVPVTYPGFKPATHFIFDTRKLDPQLVFVIEKMLYGSDTTNPRLPTIAELGTTVAEWGFKVTDHGDGRWSLTTASDEVLRVYEESFRIDSPNVDIIDEDTYTLTDEEPGD